MQQLSCPVCRTAPAELPPDLSLVRCAKCQVSWTCIAEDLNNDELYRDETYAVVDNRRSVFEKIIFSEARKVLGKARKLHGSANRLLDFGSGKGQFLAVARDLGWKGVGVETEKARADFSACSYRVEVVQEMYQGGKIRGGNFDVITLNHVLEHLTRPMALLSELLEQNLAANGVVYIEVPRKDSWQARIAGRHWVHWDIPKHLTHWRESQLCEQLEGIGFEKIAHRGFSIHLGVLGMLQALLSRLGFRDNLILRLKRRRTPALLVAIAGVLPFAWILELLSLVFGKPGIIGVYFRRQGKGAST